MMRSTRRASRRRFPAAAGSAAPMSATHLAAVEQPALFLDDVCAFFRRLR